MNSLLTKNNLGYAKDIFGSPAYNAKYGVFYFASEQSEKVATYFNIKDLEEKRRIVLKLVDGVNSFLDLKAGKLTFMFDGMGDVTLSWTNKEGHQTATFNEISLLQLMEVESVRSLVLSRRFLH